MKPKSKDKWNSNQSRIKLNFNSKPNLNEIPLNSPKTQNQKTKRNWKSIHTPNLAQTKLKTKLKPNRRGNHSPTYTHACPITRYATLCSAWHTYTSSCAERLSWRASAEISGSLEKNLPLACVWKRWENVGENISECEGRSGGFHYILFGNVSRGALMKPKENVCVLVTWNDTKTHWCLHDVCRGKQILRFRAKSVTENTAFSWRLKSRRMQYYLGLCAVVLSLDVSFVCILFFRTWFPDCSCS